MEQGTSCGATRSSASQEIATVYSVRIFITVFATIHHLSLSQWDKSSVCLPFLFLSFPPYDLLTYTYVFQFVSFFQVSPLNHLLLYKCQDSRTPSVSSSLICRHSIICWKAKVMTFFITEFFLASCYLPPPSQNIFPSISLSHTLSQFSSLNISQQNHSTMHDSLLPINLVFTADTNSHWTKDFYFFVVRKPYGPRPPHRSGSEITTRQNTRDKPSTKVIGTSHSPLRDNLQHSKESDIIPLEGFGFTDIWYNISILKFHILTFHTLSPAPQIKLLARSPLVATTKTVLLPSYRCYWNRQTKILYL